MSENINPRELRIGNKLQKSNGEVFTIKRLDKTEDVLVEEENSLLTLNYNLYGIPLTEEILLKCGFTNNDGEKYNPDDEYAEQFKYTLKSGIFYRDFECSPYKGWYVTIGDYENDNINFEYLHQLQNIFHALKGEELEIKL